MINVYLDSSDYSVLSDPSRSSSEVESILSQLERFLRDGRILKRKIETLVKRYNHHPKPFRWTATADSILAKLERLCKVLNGTAR